MDERFVKKLLVPSFLIVILSTVFVYELKYLIDVLFFKKKHILIIGILSAPENFEQRISVRKTWLQLSSEISGSSYFIIGNEICEVPPLDRADPYSCIDKPFVLPLNANSKLEFTTLKILNDSNLKTPVRGYSGFTFYVRKKISIKKLGILSKLLLGYDSDVQVKLISSFDNTVLASVTFSRDSIEANNSVTLIKAIKPVILVPSYEAYIKVEGEYNGSLSHNCKFTKWQDEPNVINFIQLWEYDSIMPFPFTTASCTYVFMKYTVVDIDEIKQHISNRASRVKEWNKYNKELSQKLQNESKTYSDLMLLDVIDVYRNISRKMVQFYKRVVDTEYFHYVLKADDDSFVDLLRVHNQLKIVNKDIDNEISKSVGPNKESGIVARLRLSKFWWWSYFKERWKVQHSGKWRENDYRSLSYPTFPCGGGYVINKGIADYIALNENNLHLFQGEDVSLGIWVSSLPTVKYKTARDLFPSASHMIQKKVIIKFMGKKDWQQMMSNKTLKKSVPDFCNWTCNNKRTLNLPMCNKVQLTVEDMYSTWQQYINTGYL